MFSPGGIYSIHYNPDFLLFDQPVNPVQNIESPVGSESKEIMAGDRLRLPRFTNHEELGQNGNTLQVDGEGPEDLHHGELVV